MIEEEKAEQEFMLKVVRGLIDKHGPIGLWEEFNAYINRNEELQMALEQAKSSLQTGDSQDAYQILATYPLERTKP